METLLAQVEDAVLDTYDLAFDRAMRSSPGAWRQELLAIQDTVSVVGGPPHRQLWAGQPPTMVPPAGQGRGLTRVPRTQAIAAPRTRTPSSSLGPDRPLPNLWTPEQNARPTVQS